MAILDPTLSCLTISMNVAGEFFFKDLSVLDFFYSMEIFIKTIFKMMKYERNTSLELKAVSGKKSSRRKENILYVTPYLLLLTKDPSET